MARLDAAAVPRRKQQTAATPLARRAEHRGSLAALLPAASVYSYLPNGRECSNRLAPLAIRGGM
jgi:hypothetical protein